MNWDVSQPTLHLFAWILVTGSSFIGLFGIGCWFCRMAARADQASVSASGDEKVAQIGRHMTGVVITVATWIPAVFFLAATIQSTCSLQDSVLKNYRDQFVTATPDESEATGDENCGRIDPE